MMIALLLLIAATARADTIDCEAERYANDLLPFAEQGLAITKELAVKNIPEFCRATTRNQAQNDLKDQVDDLRKLKSDEDIANLDIMDAWRRSYHPDPEIRLQGFLRNPALVFVGFKGGSDVKDYLINPDAARGTEGMVDMKELDRPVQVYLDKLQGFGIRKLALVAACDELVFGFECPKALDSVIQTSMPVAEPMKITQPQLYKEILLDDAYDAGLRKAALKLFERVASRDLKDADLFTDVESSFLESGVPAEKAEEMTWKTMGLLATGGANTGNRVMMLNSPKDKFARKVALAVIASLAPVLDSRSITSGKPYSYPKGVHTTCDSGKPYHFWLSAYLGWDQSRKGVSAKGAAAAAFLADKGYQMMSDTATRDPTRPLRESFLSAYSNSIRIDLAFASAGAIYGANAAKGATSTKLDVDQGVRRTVVESQPVDKLDEAAARRLLSSPVRFGLRWSKLMAPNAAFNLYRSAIQ